MTKLFSRYGTIFLIAVAASGIALTSVAVGDPEARRSDPPAQAAQAAVAPASF